MRFRLLVRMGMGNDRVSPTNASTADGHCKSVSLKSVRTMLFAFKSVSSGTS